MDPSEGNGFIVHAHVILTPVLKKTVFMCLFTSPHDYSHVMILRPDGHSPSVWTFKKEPNQTIGEFGAQNLLH